MQCLEMFIEFGFKEVVILIKFFVWVLFFFKDGIIDIQLIFVDGLKLLLGYFIVQCDVFFIIFLIFYLLIKKILNVRIYLKKEILIVIDVIQLILFVDYLNCFKCDFMKYLVIRDLFFLEGFLVFVDIIQFEDR